MICLNENAFYPWAEPHLTEAMQRIDKIAKNCGISVYASGVQDAIWHALPLAAFSALQRIDEVKITNVCNIDTLGRAVLEHCKVGTQPDEFDMKHFEPDPGETETGVPPLDSALRGLAISIGLQIADHDYSVHPITSGEDIESSGFGKVIPRGKIIGLKEMTRFTTTDGTLFTGEFISQVMKDTESAGNTLKITGKPDMEYHTPVFPGHEVTSATLVNRIPDVLRADPGFLNTNSLPAPRFRSLITR